MLLNTTKRRKGGAEELDQEARLNETILPKDNKRERQGEVHLEKKIVLRVLTTKKEIVVLIEFTRKRRNDLPVLHERRE